MAKVNARGIKKFISFSQRSHLPLLYHRIPYRLKNGWIRYALYKLNEITRTRIWYKLDERTTTKHLKNIPLM